MDITEGNGHGNPISTAESAGIAEYTNYTLQRGNPPPQQVSRYVTKQSGGEASVILELWGM